MLPCPPQSAHTKTSTSTTPHSAKRGSFWVSCKTPGAAASDHGIVSVGPSQILTATPPFQAELMGPVSHAELYRSLAENNPFQISVAAGGCGRLRSVIPCYSPRPGFFCLLGRVQTRLLIAHESAGRLAFEAPRRTFAETCGGAVRTATSL